MKTNKKNYCLVPPYKSGRVKWVATKHHEKPKTTETNHQLWKSITKILSCPPVQVYRRESANIGHHWGFCLLTLVYCLVSWGHHISISRNQHYAFSDLETNKLLVKMVMDSSGHLLYVKAFLLLMFFSWCWWIQNLSRSPERPQCTVWTHWWLILGEPSGVFGFFILLVFISLALFSFLWELCLSLLSCFQSLPWVQLHDSLAPLVGCLATVSNIGKNDF